MAWYWLREEEEEEVEEGWSQKFSNQTMAASVDPEIHQNLWNGRGKILD